MTMPDDKQPENSKGDAEKKSSAEPNQLEKGSKEAPKGDGEGTFHQSTISVSRASSNKCVEMDWENEFDTYLVKLEKSSKDDGKEQQSSSLIGYEVLQDYALKKGCKVSDLPLSCLLSRYVRSTLKNRSLETNSFHRGDFCLKSREMARIERSMSLSEYATRESAAVGDPLIRQGLSNFHRWNKPMENKF